MHHKLEGHVALALSNPISTTGEQRARLIVTARHTCQSSDLNVRIAFAHDGERSRSRRARQPAFSSREPVHDRLFWKPTHAALKEAHRHMPKHATVRLQPLQTCLVNLPLSLYGQLVSRSVTPQSLVVCLSYGGDKGNGNKSSSSASVKSKDGKNAEGRRAYVGWSGMPSRLVGGVAAIGKGQEAIEIDPICAKELGLVEGVEVCYIFPSLGRQSFTLMYYRSLLTSCAICRLPGPSMSSLLAPTTGKSW